MKLKEISSLLLALLLMLPPVTAQESVIARQLMTSSTTSPPQTKAATAPSLRLEELERLALQNNPTLAQTEAAIQAAEGRRLQAGLYPNPVVGYEGDEFNRKLFNEKSEHFFFFEQTFVTAGKLKKNRAIFAQEKAQAEAEAAAQKQRVVNATRMLYYQALGAQQLVELRQQLSRLANEAVAVSGQLFNTGAADRPDLLAIEVEAQRAELDLIKAQNDRRRVWQMLAAVVGNPMMPLAPLAGELETTAAALNNDELLTNLLRNSPELKRAQAGVERARAVIVRAKVEPKPDIFLRGGIGYSTELLENLQDIRPFGRSGFEGRVEIGVRVPLFDRNQGNIAAAQAELFAAEREVTRLELSLRARFADTFNRYQDAVMTVERYQKQILPRAQRAYELYLANFRQMSAAYPQVLITQRTLFQARTDYITALVELRQNIVELQGLLLIGGLSLSRSEMESQPAAARGSGEH